jgi:hypothetical protein
MPLSRAAQAAGWDIASGVADSFAAEGRLLAPAHTPLPRLNKLPEDAPWIRQHLAHRLERWIYRVTSAEGRPLQVKWDTFEELHRQIDNEFRKRLVEWRSQPTYAYHLREEEVNTPRPEPKRLWGMAPAWTDRVTADRIGEDHLQALCLCMFEEAAYAGFYLTRDGSQMAIGLPALGYSLAATFGYSLQALEDDDEVRNLWLDEANRLRRVYGLNGGHS